MVLKITYKFMRNLLNVALCSHCHQEQSDGAHYCKFCGTNLQNINTNDDTETTVIKTCKKCGQKIIGTQQFCQNCGAQIDDSSMNSIVVEPTAINSSNAGSANRLVNTCATGCGWPIGVLLILIGLFFIIMSIWALTDGLNILSCFIPFVFGLVSLGWGYAITKAVGYKIKL